MKQNEIQPAAQLMQFIVGRWISKPIYAAAKLGIADLLTEGPKSVEALAQESGAHAPSLFRVLRALASVGIFIETEDKYFALTPMAELLKTGVMRSIALMFNSEWSDKAWGCFLEGVKTGNTPFEAAHGMSVVDWLKKNPQAENIFNEANAIKTAGTSRAIIDVYDFSEIKTLTDVGGGVGALMTEMLKANPTMQGIVFDISSVIHAARKIIKSHSLEDRCRAVEGDFFKSIPSGSDAYLLSNILHDWQDEQCKLILRNCYEAMKKDSRLLIIEMIIPQGNEPSIAKLLDLEMFVITGGRERTEAEYKRLLESSGFRLLRIIPTKESISIIEGIKI